MSSSGVGVRIAPSPFVRDVLTSALTALLTMGSLVLVTGWLAAGFGPAGFAVYALARRVVSLAAAVAPAPLALALARAQAGALTEREQIRDGGKGLLGCRATWDEEGGAGSAKEQGRG